MVQSVELLLDDRLDDAVRAEWDRLLGAGISSAARVRTETNRPHITLAVAASIPPGIEGQMRERIDGSPIELRLGGIVVFGDRHATLARLVVPTVELLTLHREVFALLEQCPGIPPHIRPGEWTPHVTLARRVPAGRIGAAIVATHAARNELDGTSAGIRRWDGQAKREWRVV
ncbi:2'-5' RNA ligase family protein [Rhodococcus sp. NPDC003382]|uniref:2'-5' RNA ligase family protein n=1 Tax=unclassified Rhodococcus (in: high G+C Gram-positive bacteria) TaxID=192944 RepID=UPI0018CDBD75|nr:MULTISPECIES: 2'-5' RNA ligase family protein [unclassified Rhodococcus (in: high G+C Gram-positive bacteria)]MBH0119274.1 2'-5' RNA ligase family protein [Rhodococcus sp. CX]MCK8674487.1 2'-5' RNA ligase family protein [Rhodococcus sp. HM1]